MASVLYPGSFDPIHNGHLEIIETASRLFDRVHVAAMRNPQKGEPLFDLEERKQMIEESLAHVDNVEVMSFAKLVVDVATDIELLMDPEQIHRAVGNLLKNAVEATDSGEIRISARRTPHRVYIEVADPGRGVPDTDKDKLFLPYFSTKGRGTGLGLAIVHRIVRDHDGQIHVHDNHPKGTRFEIELPA